MDYITIRKPRDVLNILSGLGTDPKLLVQAWAKLKQVDLKETEGELEIK